MWWTHGSDCCRGWAISVVKPRGKAELVAELRAVRARVAELERHAAESKHAAEAARALAQVVREFVGARDLAQATERVAWTVVQFFGVHQSLLFRLEPPRLRWSAWPPPARAHPRSGSGGRCRLELAWQAWRSRKADRSTPLICSQILGSRSPNGSSGVSGRKASGRCSRFR